jgi:hypothetical protein
VGEGARGGITPYRWGFGGCAPDKISKFFTLKCVFKLISQSILNTERSYSWLLIFGYILWLFMAITKPTETCDV